MRFLPRVLELREAPGTDAILSRLRRRRGLVALDSAAPWIGSSRRWSLVAFDPLAGVRAPSGILGLRETLRELELVPGDPVPGPFHGGFLGAFSYDLGVAGERAVAVPPDPWRSPRVVGGLYVDFIVRDEERDRAWLVLGEDPGDGRPALAARRAEILAALAADAPSVTGPRPTGPLVRHTPAREHRARIERVRELIAQGDLYQANVAHRFTRPVAGDPVDLYLRLREVNPAPYMAFLAFDGGALLSASPELLLEYGPAAGGARTRPIKGTAPRGRTPDEDARNAARLLESAKDRAELAMIVDLERNDLGRIARAGGVRVEAFPRLETYASVHHLTADVVALPRAELDAIDVLAALFPGGSITGAPKLRAMEVIAEVEREGRGFFTGSLGFVDLRGEACFNILIRTLVWRPAIGNGADPLAGEVSFHVGGGITWSSDPEAEDRETLAKGAALARALEEAVSPALREANARPGIPTDARPGGT